MKSLPEIVELNTEETIKSLRLKLDQQTAELAELKVDHSVLKAGYDRLKKVLTAKQEWLSVVLREKDALKVERDLTQTENKELQDRWAAWQSVFQEKCEELEKARVVSPDIEDIAKIGWIAYQISFYSDNKSNWLATWDRMDERLKKASIDCAAAIREAVLAGENSEWIQALGLLSTLVPSMEVDVANPLAMAQEIYDHVTRTTTPAPTPEQVEALARVLIRAIDGMSELDGCSPEQQDRWRNVARAAFASIRRVSETPIVEAAFELIEKIRSMLALKQGDRLIEAVQALINRAGTRPLKEDVPIWFGPTRAEAEAKWEECKDLWDSGQEYSDWLLPLLPESAPVGVELDMTEQTIRNAWLDEEAGGKSSWIAAKAVLDLIKSHLRPVYECKECAKWESKYVNARQDFNGLSGRVKAARAALEGK